MKEPNFILAGAQKTGSTSVYHYLCSHPDVFMTKVKEPNYYNLNYENGKDWYLEQFEAAEDESVVGEGSILYMRDSEVVAPRLHADYPNIKLIFIMRNPVDRAFSHYNFRIGKKIGEGMGVDPVPFSEVIRLKDDPVKTIEIGKYYDHLMNFEKYFSREQMHLVLYDDLKADREKVMTGIYEFLGIRQDIEVDIDRVRNVTKYQKNPQLYRGLKNAYVATRDVLETVGLEKVLEPLSPVKNKTRERLTEMVEKDPPSMNAADRAFLRKTFEEPNKLLGEYLGVDLSHWNQ